MASEDTKSIGRMGWLEAQLLVERAPLIQSVRVQHYYQNQELVVTGFALLYYLFHG